MFWWDVLFCYVCLFVCAIRIWKVYLVRGVSVTLNSDMWSRTSLHTKPWTWNCTASSAQYCWLHTDLKDMVGWTGKLNLNANMNELSLVCRVTHNLDSPVEQQHICLCSVSAQQHVIASNICTQPATSVLFQQCGRVQNWNARNKSEKQIWETYKTEQRVEQQETEKQTLT